MPWTPSYTVVIEEADTDLKPIGEGEEYPEPLKDAFWNGEAESPEEAKANARAAWRAEYGEDPPEGAQVTCTAAADVCTQCDGRAWVSKYVPAGLTSHDDDPLGSALKQQCPKCLGTGKGTGKGPVRYR